MATTAARPRRAVASTGDQEVRCIPISKSPDVHDIWTLTSASLVQSQPHQIIIQAKIVDWVFANVVIETPPVNSETDMPSTIDHLVSTGLQLCRQTYGRSAPTFASTVSIQMNNRQPVVVERISQELLDELTCIDSLLGPSASEVSLVPRTNLVPVLSPGFFFCPNTRLVTHKGGKFVAKGPIYASRVEDDFLEAKNLLELPRGHPHIMPPPDVFVTVSEVDRRICGFLVPFLPNGNLDIYAPKLQAGGGLTEARLVRWFCQIVDAVAFLIEHGTWHGDLKPDNILVDDDGNLKLIDFTRKFTTDATASPEVRQHYARIGCAPGIPADWALNTIMLSEVYSVGRTMYLVSEGFSMLDIYAKHGWTNTGYDFPTVFGPMSPTPKSIRSIIERCVTPDPSQRPTIQDLWSLLRKLGLGK